MMKCPNCNETDHEPAAKFCHMCGGVLDPDESKFLDHGKGPHESCVEKQPRQNVMNDHPVSWWSKILRYSLLLLILVEYIFISIVEYESIIDTRYACQEVWALVAIMLVQVPSFICTLLLCIFANKADYDDERGAWRLYYNWLHFLAAAIVPVLGLLICSNIQNLFTIILFGLMIGLLILADFGTLEDFFD